MIIPFYLSHSVPYFYTSYPGSGIGAWKSTSTPCRSSRTTGRIRMDSPRWGYMGSIDSFSLITICMWIWFCESEGLIAPALSKQEPCKLPHDSFLKVSVLVWKLLLLWSQATLEQRQLFMPTCAAALSSMWVGLGWDQYTNVHLGPNQDWVGNP